MTVFALSSGQDLNADGGDPVGVLVVLDHLQDFVPELPDMLQDGLVGGFAHGDQGRRDMDFRRRHGTGFRQSAGGPR